jgi:N-methylhydantoinase A
VSYRIAIDTGGTFTDAVMADDQGVLTSTKAHTTPADPTIGTMNALANLAEVAGLSTRELLGDAATIVHGTTQATNIIATERGAKVGCLFTKGYRDRLSFLQVAKGNLQGEIKLTTGQLFDFDMPEPRALVEKRLNCDVEERVDFMGREITPLNEDDVRKQTEFLKSQGVEAIAICFMFSHVNPKHELRAAEIVREVFPSVSLSLSSQVLPVLGEVVRWSTTTIDAYVAPSMRAYVDRIEANLATAGFHGQLLFMQSNGGVCTPDIVRETPATVLVSGPAAAPAYAVRLTREHGMSNVISCDMGGTSFDAGVVVNGQVLVKTTTLLDEGRQYGLPSLDVSAIGAGGGSIAWLDPTGRLQVGPQSANAVPGPACYGIGGTEPTVTDADVVLGYINPDFFLGGQLKLKKERAIKAIEENIARPLGVDVAEAAAGIYEVVNAKMAGNLEYVLCKRGHDARDFVLVAAGGATATHVARIAQQVGISKYMIPKSAPTFCASGMLYADMKHNYLRSYVRPTHVADMNVMNRIYGEMENMARETLAREGVAEGDMILEKRIEMAYYGQFKHADVAMPAGPVSAETLGKAGQAFHAKMQDLVGHSDPAFPTIIRGLGLHARYVTAEPPLQRIGMGQDHSGAALKGTRKAFFRELGGFEDVPVYDGDKLLAGNVLSGPCLIEERMTTIVIPPACTMTVDDWGNYLSVQEG